jgi:hypothetical protein
MKNKTTDNQIQITFGFHNYQKAFCKCSEEEQERLLGCEEYLGKERFAKAISKDYQEFVVVDGMLYTITDSAKMPSIGRDKGAKFLAKFEPTFSCISSGGLFRVLCDTTMEQSIKAIQSKAEGKNYRYTVGLTLQTTASVAKLFKNAEIDQAAIDENKPFAFAKHKQTRKVFNQLRWLMTSDDYIFFKCQKLESVGAA